MDEQQFRALLDSRRRWEPRRLTDTAALNQVLRGAARRLRSVETAQAEWEKFAPPACVKRARPVAAADGVLTIEVSDSATMYELRRSQAALERTLRATVPGVQRVVFRYPGGEDEALTDEPHRDRETGARSDAHE